MNIGKRSASYFFGLATLSAACGGNARDAKTGPGDSAKSPHSEDSIGALAAQQGGLGGFGRGTNTTGAGRAGGPAPTSLQFEEVDAQSPVNLDGVLGEWPALLAVDGGLKVALQYDNAKIYAGLELAKASQKPISFVLAFPSSGGSFATYELAIKPGKPGESAGDVRFASGGKRGAEVAGASVVEAPSGDGLSVEATIPWSAFHEARVTRVGLRGGFKLSDSAKTTLDINAPSRLPALPTEPEIALLEGLLGPKGLPTTPTFDLYADISGDPQKERISVYGRTLTIVGPGYRGGHEFFFRELGAELVALEVRDLTGDVRAELILRKRAGDPVSREWVEVLAFDKSDDPRSIFAHDLVVARGKDRVVNAMKLGTKTIEIVTDANTTWDPKEYKDAGSSEAEPLLLPWGPTKAQTFEFDGTRFSKTNEVTQKATGPVPGERTHPTTATKTPEAVAPPTPKETAGGTVQQAVLERFKKDRGHENAPIRKDLQVNVAEDTRPERVVLIGRDLVVFGPGFLGGASYAYASLEQFADPSGIDLSTRDLTGDGAAELILRGNANLQTGADPTEASLLIVYSVTPNGLRRIFAVETARSQKGKRVQGLVQFVPNKNGKTFDIDVRPGKAEGWTEKTYPFAPAQPGSGPVEPLLLPWGKPAKLQYVWNGSAFARE